MVIGIIGGGQLGMMMAEAALELGHQIIGLDPNPKCSLSKFATKIIIADYNAESAIQQLINETDVITYEFENVDLDLIDENLNKIPQGSKALRMSRNRLVEKKYATSLTIPTPKFAQYNNKDSLFKPSVIKTTTGGYDGKGQYIIRDSSDIDHISLNSDIEYIIEDFINFDYEISVVATRDVFNNVVFFPIPKNTHQESILFTSEIYNDISSLVVTKAVDYTKTIITDLEYIGTLAVEYFVKDDEVIFNEFAPRPHNSGHYTIEGCNVSQFTNHILAITSQKIINPVLLHNTVMINEIGKNGHFVAKMNLDYCTYHDYYKTPRNDYRKMGHITCISQNIYDLKNVLENIIGEENE